MSKQTVTRRPPYRVFLTHNSDPTQGFVREAADRAGTRHHCEVIDAAGGKGARGPAELVLERLMTAGGLLVILRQETSWTSSVIGMGFALRILAKKRA